MTEAREKASSTQSDRKGEPKSKDFENLRKVYELTCARHRAIDDLRGKLLALLPIASAGAGLLLLTKPEEIQPYATVIGLYGCAITVGLFLYELRGINECGDVMEKAGDLEDQLETPPGMGQFRDERMRPLRGLVGAEMASWVVYFSVFGGWLYLAGSNGWWHHVPATLIVIVAAVALLVKSVFVVREEKKRRKRIEERKEEEAVPEKEELEEEAGPKKKELEAPLSAGAHSAPQEKEMAH